MIMRLLLLVGIIGLAWLVLKRWLTPPAPTRPQSRFQPMVRCAQCGLHVPEDEAIGGPDDTRFCCSEHRQAHAQRD